MMKRVCCFFVLICFLIMAGQSFAGNIHQWRVGAIEIAIPANINEINLYHFSQNSAWLEASDSLNWMTISFNSQNSWGELRRWWDAYGVHQNDVRFTGQKHVSPTQAFYGSVQYNMDYLSDVNRAIEIEPYAPDPFVPCDSMQGDFSYIGPQVEATFSHRLLKNLWWGVGLNYKIYRGLKKVYSMPEIIRRKITTDLSLAYRLSGSIVIGLSLKPFDVLDIIKIARQPDGTSPIIFRYRGEFLFTSITSTDDRNARTKGLDVQPQIMFDFTRLKGVMNVGYKYVWHEVYDSPLVRRYDGYYQGQDYYFSTLWRYFLSASMKNSLSLRYRFRYLEDWAEEPVKRMAIYRSYQRFHHLTIGFSRKMGSLHPLTVAIESDYQRILPDKRDYLARIYRNEPISAFDLKIGGIYSPYPRWYIQTGMWYRVYNEPEIWHYYGDYRAKGGALGVAFYQGKTIWLLNADFGQKQGVSNHRSQNQINVQIQLRKFL
ncbi:hypothetical protein Calab_3523 [Caldithrix abyssi DSM 13497]|uniref:DUF6850 domain-containing protein n=1 Tax=Caldithrix abyssi DSM 13497 TaxID=880073 RepID=H1XXJ8_CALAY|nr:DUF6850 family outer membrane beta-barrel protein [Caldithrix abyssi]APF19211.1 hypothetical protein Cabys_2462 [Caldithrix abyssi DSM 13497]EHO43122.1 hypothetical protein Calab_3523 [Caldithrix abyssi DSM 13497]